MKKQKSMSKKAHKQVPKRERSAWREMAMILGLLQQAINPISSLFKSLEHWDKLAHFISEPTRKKRTSQATSLRHGQFG